VGAGTKDDPADVSKDGFDALMKGEGDVVSGWKKQDAIRDCALDPDWVIAFS
jgi:hypothetical protein